MHLVVGIGNPGSSYSRTRHNIGFMVVDRIARSAGKAFQPAGRLSLVCENQNASRLILAKPQTYMNRSGRSVQELMGRFQMNPSEVLIVYDEMALPLGTLRIRRSGSSGGNKGMQSVIETIGTEEIPRLRIGIRPEIEPEDYSAFVLSPFTRREFEVVEEVLNESVQAIETWTSAGIEQAMSLYN